MESSIKVIREEEDDHCNFSILKKFNCRRSLSSNIHRA